LIIIEGFDNTGKTTLAKELQRVLHFDYLHSPGPMDKGKQMMDWALREMAADRYAIYDRLSIISDPVYAPIVRKERSAYETTQRGQAIRELLRVSPHLIIYCRPANAKIIRFGNREQMIGVIDHAYELLDRYDRHINQMIKENWNIVFYDYEDPEAIYLVMNKIDKYLSERLRGGM